MRYPIGSYCDGMIIHGVGCANRRLSLRLQFFKNKALAPFFIALSQRNKCFDDPVFGEALDAISAYGATQLFAKKFFSMRIVHGFLGKMGKSS